VVGQRSDVRHVRRVDGILGEAAVIGPQIVGNEEHHILLGMRGGGTAEQEQGEEQSVHGVRGLMGPSACAPVRVEEGVLR
jgi:hypothetical protein